MNWQRVFHPKRIAIVGASRDPAKVGHRLVVNSKQTLSAEIVPVNPQAGEIAGLPSFPSLTAIGKEVDVVIIAVPPAVVEKVIAECELIRPAAVVLITAGFAELGDAGAEMQRRIAERLERAGIGLIGPNTMGYVYTPNNVNFTFGPSIVSPGKVAILSQSGALLSAAFQAFSGIGDGISLAVSLGNKAGMAEHDFLDYLAEDKETSVVLLYLESVSDPKRFLQACSKTAMQKPVFLLQGGVTADGMRASASHTAALATSASLMDSAQRQAGFVLVDSLEALLRAGMAAARLRRLPQNTAVVTNAGGPSVVFVDELSRAGVPMAPFSDRTVRELHDRLPSVHAVNPLDLLGDARPQDFGTAVSLLLADPGVDAISVIITEQSVTNPQAAAEAISAPPRQKGVFAALPAGDAMSLVRKTLRAKGVFAMEYPNQIAEMLGALVRAGRLQQKIRPFVPAVPNVKKDVPFPKDYEQFCALLSAEGFVLPRQEVIHHSGELSRLEHMTFPLIAKTTAMDLKHKANVGAVLPQLAEMDRARSAYDSLSVWKAPVVFQEYAKGMELLVGCVQDERFGWFLAFGLGGSYTNVLADRRYVFLPADRDVLRDQLLQTKAGGIATERQREKILDFLAQVGQFALRLDGVREFEFNPVFVTDSGCVIADLKRS